MHAHVVQIIIVEGMTFVFVFDLIHLFPADVREINAVFTGVTAIVVYTFSNK